MEQHRKAVDGESQLSDEVDQAPLPKKCQSQCLVLPFPPQKKKMLWMDEFFEWRCKKVEDLGVHR